MTVKIFVGTSPNKDDEISEKILEYTLRQNCSEPIELVFMRNDNNPDNFFSGFNSEGWATPFTNLRWAIPEYCDFKGRAIYMDVDMINFRDISELFHTDIEDKALACREGWRTCIALLDCEKLKNVLPPISVIKKDSKFNQKNAGDLCAQAYHIDSRWNCLDGEGLPLEDIWHLHWTNMPTQPWHPAWAKRHYDKQGIKFVPADHPRIDLVQEWNSYRRKVEEPTKEHTVVATLPLDKWEYYGKDFISTFDALWPKEIALRLYVEGGISLPIEVSERIEILSLEEELLEVEKFQKRNKHRGYAVDNLDVTAGGDWRTQASKFCRKGYAILKELENPKTRYVWYMDADIETLKEMPLKLLNLIVDYGCYIGGLPRKGVDGIFHTETGFGYWDTKNPWHKIWCKNYRACWDEDILFNFEHWTDCFAWDYATSRLSKYKKIEIFDLGGGANKTSSHPLNDGSLGEFINHKKGARKYSK